MAKTAKQSTDHTTQRPDIDTAGMGQATASRVMMELWRKASPRLTNVELAWLSESGEEVSTSLNCIASLLTRVACLSGELEEGDFPTLDALKMSDVLYPVIDQLHVLSSMSFIATEAAHKLNNPSHYREGGMFHGH
jgi:hypothetical protein